AELCHYFSDHPSDVMKDTDIIKWWLKHRNSYPTLAQIAKDVCAIPASSVPCEQLFSAGAEIATDHCSHLGTDKFKHLQILKHTWHQTISDHAKENLSEIEIVKYKELAERDVELAEYDQIDEQVMAL
ncbi:hypothetical protein SCLCIDRAFT_145797, partial [Scleroderma citrinum Foug A]